jgi:hypothetical protein
MRVSATIVEFEGRQMVAITTEEGTFAFYRRTGAGGPAQGWAQQGAWVPFEGVGRVVDISAGNGRVFAWIIKPAQGRTGAAGAEALSRFLTRYFESSAGGAHSVMRLGAAEAKIVNEWLKIQGVSVAPGLRAGAFRGSMLFREIPQAAK